MAKTPSKKSVERRRSPRGTSSSRSATGAPAKRKRAAGTPSPKLSPKLSKEECCIHCSKDLRGEERALFVEEDVGRIFCSEECITAHFTPEIERLEKEYFRYVSGGDLTGEEREKLAHLRWVTLQEPDEVWRQKTLAGDFRYTLISEFRPGAKPVWFICICLLLRGEPSFLYLAFPTKNAAMVNHYRRGEHVEIVRPESRESKASASETGEGLYADAEAERGHRRSQSASQEAEEAEKEAAADREETATPTDGLAEPWTEEENMAARRRQDRSPDDIPEGEYDAYEACFNETLETPDEVWSLQGGSDQEEEPVRLYHFIRYFGNENPGIWFVIVARETDNEEEIEVLDAFPTRDAPLVERYRTGSQEVGGTTQQASGRMVH